MIGTQQLTRRRTLSLADPDRVHTLLAAAGYDGITLTAFNEPYQRGHGG